MAPAPTLTQSAVLLHGNLTTNVAVSRKSTTTKGFLSRRGRRSPGACTVRATLETSSSSAGVTEAVSAENLPPRTVLSPVNILASITVPMMPKEVTVEGGLASWVEASTAELKGKRIEGSVVDHLINNGIMGEEVKGGLIAEFGVFQGESLRRIAAKTSKTVYGFDSFEGFPTDWDLPYGLKSPKEFFDTGGDLVGYKPENVELVRGFFSDSLPAWLEAHPEPFSYVNIDCDMYVGTADIFTLAEDRFVPGTIISFDEFFCGGADDRGEFTAFYEWLQRTGRKFEFIGYGEGSHALMQQFPEFGDSAFVDKVAMAVMFRAIKLSTGKDNFETSVALRITA